MEDYTRDLEKELTKYSVPNPFKKSKTWQLMFVSEDGKVITIRNYRAMVLSIAVILILTTVISVGASVLYYRSLKTASTLKTSMAEMESKYNVLKKKNDLYSAKQFFGEKLKDTLKEPEAKPEISPEKKPETKVPVKKVEKKKTPMSVTLNDITTSRDEGSSQLKIRFIIKNESKRRPIAGRVFAVLKPDSEKSQEWVALPPVILKGGEPSLPSRGQFFSINNYKSVKFRFNNRQGDNHYKKMTVFVFTTEGEKVFEETYPLKIDVIKKKVVPPVAKPAETPKAEKQVVKKPEPKKPAGSSVDTGTGVQGSAPPVKKETAKPVSEPLPSSPPKPGAAVPEKTPSAVTETTVRVEDAANAN